MSKLLAKIKDVWGVIDYTLLVLPKWVRIVTVFALCFAVLVVCLVLGSDMEQVDKWSALGSLASILALIPIAIAGYEIVYGDIARQRKMLNLGKKLDGAHEAILYIDLLPSTDIKATIEKQSKKLGLDHIPEEMIKGYSWKGSSFISRDEVGGVLVKGRKEYQKLLASGANVVHFFYGGPGAIASMFGSRFSNQVEVRLYHWNENSYELWGPLNEKREAR